MPKVELLSDYKIVISEVAYVKMKHYVAVCEDEIGWLGVVERKGNVFIIEDVFLANQEVSATTCIISEEGIGALVQDIFKENAAEKAIDLSNRIRFWGHSHVNMGVSPSMQDTTQLKELSSDCRDFFIKGIFNKSGKAFFSIILLDTGIKISDVESMLYFEYDQSLLDQVKKDIEDKVTKKTYTYSAYNSDFNIRKAKKTNDMRFIWSISPTFLKGEKVTHSGLKYTANKKNSGKVPGFSPVWDLESEETKKVEASSDYSPYWNLYSAYEKGEVVQYDYFEYIALIKNTNKRPDLNVRHWEVLEDII